MEMEHDLAEDFIFFINSFGSEEAFLLDKFA